MNQQKHCRCSVESRCKLEPKCTFDNIPFRYVKSRFSSQHIHLWETEASFKGVGSIISMFIPRVIRFLSKSQMLYLNLYCCEQ